MSKPLGMIIDANPNGKQIGAYALVINNFVVNCIVASYNDILSIYQSYDYCVDMTYGNKNGGPGDTYNASNNTFIAPPAPPIDWPQNVEFDFDGVIGALQQVMNDSGSSGGSLTVQQINAAYNSALNDNPGLDQPTLTLMATVLQYVLAGG